MNTEAATDDLTAEQHVVPERPGGGRHRAGKPDRPSKSPKPSKPSKPSKPVAARELTAGARASLPVNLEKREPAASRDRRPVLRLVALLVVIALTIGAAVE